MMPNDCPFCEIANSDTENISEYLAEGKLENSHDQQIFRNFMISINIRSNGRYFGDMTKGEVFDFLDGCR